MSEFNWREREEQIERAIDALNAEQPPPPLVGDAADDPDLAEFLDTLRIVRQLREPAWPDANFEDDLADTLAARLMTPEELNRYRDNGHMPVAPPPRAIRPSRGRMLLVAAAALVRAVGVGVIAGMIAGLVVGGVGGRIVMRFSAMMYQREHPLAQAITESSGREVGRFTLSGTIELLITGMFFGIVGGIFYVVLRRWLPGRGWTRGLLFGALLLAITGVAVFDGDNTDFRRFGSPLVNVGMFGSLFLLFGLVVAPLVDRLDRATPRARPRRRGAGRSLSGFVAIIGAGIAGLPILVMIIGGTAFSLVAVLLVATGLVQQPDNTTSVSDILTSLFVFSLVVLLPLVTVLQSSTLHEMAIQTGGRTARLLALARNRRVVISVYIAFAIATLAGLLMTVRQVLDILS